MMRQSALTLLIIRGQDVSTVLEWDTFTNGVPSGDAMPAGDLPLDTPSQNAPFKPTPLFIIHWPILNSAHHPLHIPIPMMTITKMQSINLISN
jgi:hypothetical protein